MIIRNNWGERERAPTLFMSMKIMSVRPSLTTRFRMRERSNSAELAGFKRQLVLQLLIPGSGSYVPNTARKRPSDETGTAQATGQRQAC